MATKRLELGMEPIVGDLVFQGAVDELENINHDDAYALDEKDNEDDYEKASLSDKSVKNRVLKLPDVYALTALDIASNKFSIYDVILPIPGTGVVFPENQMKQLYLDFMEADGVPMERLHVAAKMRIFNCCGGYRRVLVTPKNFSLKEMQYNDMNLPLILSDWDIMNNAPPIESGVAFVFSLLYADGKLLALVLKFQLSSSCYATMLLREFCKQSSEKKLQNALMEQAQNAAFAPL